jgi:hypothetical protein
LFGGEDRIRLPRTILPPAHGGADGWFKLRTLSRMRARSMPRRQTNSSIVPRSTLVSERLRHAALRKRAVVPNRSSLGRDTRLTARFRVITRRPIKHCFPTPQLTS